MPEDDAFRVITWNSQHNGHDNGGDHRWHLAMGVLAVLRTHVCTAQPRAGAYGHGGLTPVFRPRPFPGGVAGHATFREGTGRYESITGTYRDRDAERDMTTTLLTDHPAWLLQPDGTVIRLIADGPTAWLACWAGADLEWHHLSGDGPAPSTRRTPAYDLPPAAPTALRTALADLGTVERMPNPSLWDAITTGLLRRIVRAEQARKLYGRWCAAYGQRHETPAGAMYAVPSPETVLDLDETAYREVGALFHAKALPSAAAAYREHAEEWAVLAPGALVTALQSVSGIGPWTAAAVAADFTGDYVVYPHDDLAVRTWAAEAAPELGWPDNSKGFAARWHLWAPTAAQIHALTTFTLAWGIHARTAARHRDAA